MKLEEIRPGVFGATLTAHELSGPDGGGAHVAVADGHRP